MSYDNTDRGVLFKNDRAKNDRHPNLTGQINIGGVEYWLAGWTKTIRSGKRQGEKMIQLSATPKDDQPQQQSSDADSMDHFDDDIPF